MYTAFLWNETRVTRLAAGPMDLPNLRLAGKELFDRLPVMGYFETRYKGGSGNDFLLVNVHLASGQNNDENHLIAMTPDRIRSERGSGFSSDCRIRSNHSW